jgi:primosomal replication protein N
VNPVPDGGAEVVPRIVKDHVAVELPATVEGAQADAAQHRDAVGRVATVLGFYAKGN